MSLHITRITANKFIEMFRHLIMSFSSAVLVLCPVHGCTFEATCIYLKQTKQQLTEQNVQNNNLAI